MSATGRRKPRRRGRGARAPAAEAEDRAGWKSGLLILVISLVALLAILLRLAEFSGRRLPHRPPAHVSFRPGLR